MIRSTFGNMFRPMFLHQEVSTEVINLDFSRVSTEPVSVPDSSLSVMVVDPSSFSAAYDYSLCDALSQAGCRVTLAQDGGLGTPSSQDRTFSLWRNFYRGRYGSKSLAAKAMKGADHFLGMRRFATECKTVQPDVIHFQWLPLPFIDKLYLSRLEKVAPLVLTLHNTTLFHGSPTSRLQGFGFESVFKHFSAVVVHTEFSRKKILELGWCAPEKLHVIPHGVLECHQGTANIPDAGTGQEQKLLFFGHVRVYKGVDLLIRAFAQLPPDLLASTRLVIAGKPGMDASELQQLAQALGVNHRIDWHLRFVPDEEIPAFFSQASLVVLPYRDIDQSGVLMTAIAFEKPIVASRIGGIPEVIQDGVHGRLGRTWRHQRPGCGPGRASTQSRTQGSDAEGFGSAAHRAAGLGQLC